MFFHLRAGKKINQRCRKKHVNNSRRHHRRPGDGRKSDSQIKIQMLVEVAGMLEKSRVTVFEMSGQDRE